MREKRVALFLEAYRKCGVIKVSARAARVAQCSHWNWLSEVPGYQERFAEVHAEVVARLAPIVEAELVNRAIEGVREYEMHEGQIVFWPHDEDGVPMRLTDPRAEAAEWRPLVKTKKSDSLLIHLAQRLMPEYANRQKVSITGANGGPVQTETSHKFDHDRFAELFRGRFGGDRTRDGSAPTNGN